MDKKELVSKLWLAQINAIAQISPTEMTNCRTAARMLRYAMKLDQMAKDNLAIKDDDNWRAVKASAQSLLEELVSVLPSMLFNIDPELEKMDNVISLSEAIIEATKRIEEEILDEQEDAFELVINESEFVNLL